MFNKLTPKAQAHCIDEYYSRVFPYDEEGTREDAEYNIMETLESCPDLTIDEAGNWYSEGVRI